jgi:hypothetical protein
MEAGGGAVEVPKKKKGAPQTPASLRDDCGKKDQ